MCCNVFFVISKVEFFGGGCFYVDLINVYVVIFGKNLLYSVDVWCYFWCLCYDGCIGVVD